MTSNPKLQMLHTGRPRAGKICRTCGADRSIAVVCQLEQHLKMLGERFGVILIIFLNKEQREIFRD